MMDARRGLGRALVFTGLLLAVTACSQPATPASDSSPQQQGQAPPSQASAPSQADAPKRGGIFTFSAGGSSYAGTDPAMGQQGYNVFPIIGEMLLRRDVSTWELKPGAIEKWDFSPDGKELVLNVRKGMKFHDKPPVNGREVEAKDVVYTLKTISGLQYPQMPSVRFPRRSNYEEMTDAVATDKYTVKVTLTGPSATFMDGLAEYRSAVVLPDQLREHFGGPESLLNPDLTKYVASGPFLFSKFTNQVEAEYDRSPNYYEIAPDGKAKPYLDKIRAIWIPDKATENAAFISGQIDVVGFRNNQDRDLIISQKKDTTVVTYEPSSCWYRMAFNLQRKPFDDVRVRRALFLVLDPVQTGKQMIGEWDGKALWRLPGPVPWVFPEAISQEELAKLPGYRTDKKAEDIAEARRLLSEAGIGGGFEFELLTMASLMEEQAQLAQEQIVRSLPGVKINLKIVDNAINQELAAKGNFDVQYYCYIHDPNAVGMMKTAYSSKGGRNYPRFKDEQMDLLLDQAGRELDFQKRTQLMRQAQMRALELVPFAPTYHYATQVALQPYVRDIRYGAATDRQVWFKETWVDR